MNRTLRLLCAIFLFSGFCGLIYQSIWSHYLKLFLGHAAYSQTLVLIVFIGGMAAGAWLAGRFSSRIKNVIFAYAMAEFLVGVIAVVFHSVYVASTEWAYASLLPTACNAETWCAAQWLLGAVLILPQSVLLGTTFPMMTAAVLRLDPSDSGRKVGLLYFLNSMGAVLGVLASSFLLIPQFGLPGAQLTAGIGNIALAICAYYIGKANAEAQRGAAAMNVGDGPPIRSKEVAILLAISALTGLSSFIYEIVWIRMLSQVLGSSTHAFEIMLASFIFGLAFGSWWISRRIDRIGDTVRYLAIVQVVMGSLAILTLPVYDQMFDVQGWLLGALARTANGYVLFNVTGILIASLIMVPATFCAGMTLPLITYRLLRMRVGERSIGYVYAVNTVGAIAGVTLAVLIGLPLLGTKGSLITAGAIDIVLGIVLLATLSTVGLRHLPHAAATLAASAIAVSAILFFELDPLKTASSVFRTGVPRLDFRTESLYRRDGRTATVQVIRMQDGTVAILTNGKTDGGANMSPASTDGKPWEAASDETTMVLTGALPLAFHPTAKNAAVIGFGTGISTATLLGSPNLKEVVTIEIEPAIVEGAQRFEPLTSLAYKDPRSRIIFDDARSYFARGQKRYDMIVSEPSNPWVSGVSNLFTEEFYQRIRRYLHDDGIFVQWIQIYEINPRLLASIVAAFSKTFPSWEVYAPNSGDLILIATKSGAPLRLSADLMSMPELKKKLERIDIRTMTELKSRRLGSSKDVGLYLTSLRSNPNSDFFPIVDREGSKARFMRESANAVHQAVMTPIPAGELLAGKPQPEWADSADIDSHSPQERTKASAQLVWGYMMNNKPLPASFSRTWKDELFKTRAAFIECSAAEAAKPADNVTGLLGLASEMSPFLSSAQATKLWGKILAQKCFGDDSKVEQWVRLFHAVAARDSATMATMAQQMTWVYEQPGDLTKEYVFSAAVVGLYVSKGAAEAQRYYQAHVQSIAEPRRSTPFLSYLRLAIAASVSQHPVAVGAPQLPLASSSER